MTYTEWALQQDTKLTSLIRKLSDSGLSSEEIIAYFDFENMVEHEPTYCGLYAAHTKCHNIDNLNCFFCGCPYFVYTEEGITHSENKTLYSSCTIKAVNGGQFISDNAIHHDCTNCTIPHKTTFAEIHAPPIIIDAIYNL